MAATQQKGGRIMEIVLIPGLWLHGSAWADVADVLGGLGHHAVAVTLPGQGDGASSATLDDQVAAVLAAVDAAPGRPVVVGHSAAATLAWIAADARPDKLARVVLVGGFPSADGRAYADFFEPSDGFVAFPGWGAFEGPDSADLDEQARRRFEAAAIPVPASVTKGIVHLSDDRRFDVPVVIVCPEFTPATARGWVDAGEIPELARARRVDYVDIDSGHWPMLTKPVELARLLAGAEAGRSSQPDGDAGLDD
jgi:pimeloyl-ACP methyl ester carboxylesterase